MRRPELEVVGVPGLPKAQGANRFVWDYSLPGPWGPGGGGGRGGPMALPGRYRLTLASGDWKETQELVVRADPRLEKDGVTLAVLREQFGGHAVLRDGT